MAAGGARRWWALGAISLAILAITLDVTVLNLALPTLSLSLKATESQLQWFVTAYTLALVAAMLPSGLLGDRFGHRRLMSSALFLFALGSLACAYAPGPQVFIAARVLLGVAGAALIVVALSTVTVLFDEAERPRAVGIWSAANFIGMPLGPIIGGWILSHAWWGWIFLMNVPVSLLAIVAVLALVPESKSPKPPRIDSLGLLLACLGLVGIMYGVIQAGQSGWGSLPAIGYAVLGLLVLTAFSLWEARVDRQLDGEPLVDLGLFRSRRFSWGVILTALGITGLFGVLFTLPQYLQAIAGLDAQGAGIRLLPVITGMIVGAVPADRVAERIGAKLTVAGGFLIVAAGALLGAATTAKSGDGFIVLWTFVIGAGGGLGFATAASTALVELPKERSGVGSALLQAVVKLGPAFGASILGSVLNGTYQHGLSLRGLPAQLASIVKESVFGGVAVAHQLGSQALLSSVVSAFVSGMDRSQEVAAGIAGVSLLLALLFFPSTSRAKQGSDASKA